MLIHIKTSQLRLGMYVHELGGSWMDNPFWRGAFLLDKKPDLKTILSAGIKEVWIDDSKGLGIEGGEDEVIVAVKTEAILADANTAENPVERVNIAQEAARAAMIFSKSKQAVTSMFNEARTR